MEFSFELRLCKSYIFKFSKTCKKFRSCFGLIRKRNLIKHLTTASSLNIDKHSGWCHKFSPPIPTFDWSYILDKDNEVYIKENIRARKCSGAIARLHELNSKLLKEEDPNITEQIWDEMVKEAGNLPNSTHRDTPIGAQEQARQISIHGCKRAFGFKVKDATALGTKLNMLRMWDTTITTGNRSYYFLNDLVSMEHALVNLTLKRLKKEGFTFVSVPDLLHPSIVESCGFPTEVPRNQVYKLNSRHGDICLSGTSEMALAGMFTNENFQMSDLPLYLAAVSRCHRAEVSHVENEKGIYRVHNFTKVEMFGITAQEKEDESEIMHMKMLDIQKSLYRDLGLHFRVLDMPSEELGAAAFRKFDIECWMPAKEFWGEISSASNCTDYQARRLGIRYKTGAEESPKLKFVHTVNGTACAIPRLIMAILENYQNQNGTVDVPTVLQPYMQGATVLKRLNTGKFTYHRNIDYKNLPITGLLPLE